MQDIDGEKCELLPEDEEVIATVGKLLGLDSELLKPVLLLRQINVRGNVTEIPLRLQEVHHLILLSELNSCLKYNYFFPFPGPRKQTCDGSYPLFSNILLVT